MHKGACRGRGAGAFSTAPVFPRSGNALALGAQTLTGMEGEAPWALEEAWVASMGFRDHLSGGGAAAPSALTPGHSLGSAPLAARPWAFTCLSLLTGS